MKKFIASILFFNCFATAITAQSKRIEFTAPDRYPEGTTYDTKTKMFYVSGVRMGTVGSVDTNGKYMEIYSDSNLKSTYGMKIMNGMLWVCAGDANYSKYKSDATHKKTAMLIGIDLAAKTKKSSTDLSQLYNGKHFPNDVALDNNGNAYVTDSYSPVIYKISTEGKSTVYAQNDLFHSAGVGLNGVVWHPDGYLLVVNNGAGDVLKVSDNGQTVAKVAIPQFFSGADGILIDENKNLVLVQNKGVNRIFKIKSTDGWKSAKVIAATKSADLFSFPSTATLRNNEVWVMNAKLNELSDENAVPSQKFTLQKANFVPVK